MVVQELRIDLRPRIKKLRIFAREKAFSPLKTGEWVSSTKGQGLEFAGYRAYLFGDDARLIDWKASLRTHELVVREFEEERILNVLIMLDVSESMLFSSKKKLKAEYAAEIANNLANGLINTGDAVGLLVFSDKVKKIVYPDTGGRTYRRITDILTNKELYGGDFSLVNALKFVVNRLKSNAMLIIISDFIGLSPSWKKWLEIASRRFEVIGICVRDPVDRQLPNEAIQLLIEDPVSHEKLLIDAKQYSKRYNSFVKKQEQELRETFSKNRSGFLLLETKKDFVDTLLRFFYARYKVVK